MTSPLNISTIKKVKIPQGMAAWTSITLRKETSVTRQAAADNTSNGFDAVNVSGGMMAWAGAGLPIVT